MPRKVRLSEHHVRATLDTTTFNEKDRTVEVVFATEAEVVRYGWDGKYVEVLDCRETSVRLERLNSGAPVLDNHSAYSLKNQIGVVVRAWAAGNECRALLRFSDRDDIAGVISDIKNGIIRNVSVGYRVYTYEQSEKAKDEVPTYRALDLGKPPSKYIFWLSKMGYSFAVLPLVVLIFLGYVVSFNSVRID